VGDTFRITYKGFGQTEIVALFFVGNLLTPIVGTVDFAKWITLFQQLGQTATYESRFRSLRGLGEGFAMLASHDGRILAREGLPKNGSHLKGSAAC
jgi:hypothetical protein